jgi:hypothetical protein
VLEWFNLPHRALRFRTSCPKALNPGRPRDLQIAGD